MIQLGSIMDRLGVDDEDHELKKIAKRRADAIGKVAEIKARYVEGRTPEEVLHWARGCSSLTGNRAVRKPQNADHDADLTEVVSVRDVVMDRERDLVIYYDARDGMLYSYPYATD